MPFIIYSSIVSKKLNLIKNNVSFCGGGGGGYLKWKGVGGWGGYLNWERILVLQARVPSI